LTCEDFGPLKREAKQFFETNFSGHPTNFNDELSAPQDHAPAARENGI
jgi:hypothetical protein